MAEHAVLAYLRLSDGEFGGEGEIESIHELTDRLAEAIESAGVGEFDGDEFGDGECSLYMYGPDADALFASIEPILRNSSHATGGHVIKRYGDADDPEAKEVRVDL